MAGVSEPKMSSSSSASSAADGFYSAVPAELGKVLAAAERFARAAGKVMLDRGGGSDGLGIEEKSSSKDLVTKIDKACYDVIESGINTEFPDHAMLGEESTAAGSAASKAACTYALEKHSDTYLWIVDPIDGTTMFVFDLKCSVVSIGVAHKGQVVVGVIYHPYRDDMFSAVRGCGARLNCSPIRVDAGVTSLSRSLVTYGHHTQREARETMHIISGGLAEEALAIRNLGSAALHLAYVACGRCTAFVELDLNSWDLSAGTLLVTEAGGKCTDTRGAEYGIPTRDILASNGQGTVHADLLGLLARVGGSSVLPPAVVDELVKHRWSAVKQALGGAKEQADAGAGQKRPRVEE